MSTNVKFTKSFAEYIREELKYYDEHPEEQDTIEAHSNGMVSYEVEYTTAE